MKPAAQLDLAALVEFVENEFRRQFRSVIDQITLPIARRVDAFTCWPSVVVKSVDSETQKVELSFDKNPSKLRVNDYVYVNDITVEPKDVISGPEGVIEVLDEAKKRLVVVPAFRQNSRFERRFKIGDRLVLDQTLPGEHTSRAMPVLALRLLAGQLGDSARLRHLRKILEGGAASTPIATPPVDFSDALLSILTQAQTTAVERAVTTDFALIQGPPGTGKTFVLGLIIRELVRRGKKVGVCAFTHQAIQNVLLECLKYKDIKEVGKLGSRGNWTASATDPRLRLIERPGAFFRQKSTPDVVGFTQHAAFHPVARALEEGVEGALPSRFDVLIFDEAGQLTIPAAIMAMVQCDRLIFAGDHRQLPPVVGTVRPGVGAGMSVFQHLVERAGHEPVLLDVTYRMNDRLTEFPSKEFYGRRLVAAPSAAQRTLEGNFSGPFAEVLSPDRPSTLCLLRHEGRGQESPEEAAFVAGVLEAALAAGVPPHEIAVVSPHRRQNARIAELAATLGRKQLPVIDTVERIQGQERDLVILSMTLSDPELLAQESEFLFLPNRFNVAITRARKKLIVVASPNFFRAIPRRYALETDATRQLSAMNVLKRWYLSHREASIDVTDLAAIAARDLSAETGREKSTAP